MLTILLLYFSIISAFNPGDDGVRLGLLVPDKTSAGMEAIHAVELAVARMNQSGGCNGTPFELVVRTCEGPWGVGSKASVALVFDDNVRAILGSLDGRNAHLAEQVAAKSHVVLMSARATDPTLSRAFVPWYYRLVPDDRQQAAVLVKDMKNRGIVDNIIVLAEDNYDGKMASDAFIKTAGKSGFGDIKDDYFGDGLKSPEDIAQEIIASEPEAMVVFGINESIVTVIRKTRTANPDLLIYGGLSFVFERQYIDGHPETFEGVHIVYPRNIQLETSRDFEERFKNAYGYTPGLLAAYAFDGASILMDVMRDVGSDRQKIRDRLSDMKSNVPLTGPVQFETYGNRKDPVTLFVIRGGRFDRVE